MHATTPVKLAAACTFLALLAGYTAACAQAPAANLTGRVSSAAEGAMEGVLVSARKDGSNITYTVVSDAAGRFDFAPARLAAGRYALLIRAVGFTLDGAPTVDVPAQGPASIDLN